MAQSARGDRSAPIFVSIYLTAAQEMTMLFHITQRHTPENCPVDAGGSNSLFDPNVEGLKLIGRYGRTPNTPSSLSWKQMIGMPFSTFYFLDFGMPPRS